MVHTGIALAGRRAMRSIDWPTYEVWAAAARSIDKLSRELKSAVREIG